MSKKDNDTELIRKYLKGELNAHAMHQLERKAQDDPFLMDALEGYEKAGGYQHKTLTELSERLQMRVTKKEGRIIPWKIIAFAASVLIVATIGGLFLFNNQKTIRPQIAQVIEQKVKPPVAKPITTQATVDTAKPTSQTVKSTDKMFAKKSMSVSARTYPILKEVTISRKEKSPSAAEINSVEAISSSEIKKGAVDTVNNEATPLNETIVMGYASQAKKSIPTNQNESKDLNKMLEGRVAGVTSTPAPGSSNLYDLASRNIISGKVLGKDDGLPIVGANVKVAGTNNGTITDINGNFNLKTNSKDASLLVGYIGYQTAQINALSRKDSITTIRLEPNNSSLAEVVVTQYGENKNETATSAHPKQGWDSFNKYLKDNAISPDGQTGVVKLSFQVDNNGYISNIKVVKSLSSDADQKAIELIKNGPQWFGNLNGKVEEVKVRIKF